MSEAREKYLNPFTDFGFKKLFGEEPNKELLVDFLNRVPDSLREKIFDRLFEVAEIAKLSPEEFLSYEDSLKYYRDLKNSLDTAFEEGFEEGQEKGFEEGQEKGKIEGKIEGKMEVIRQGHLEGISIDVLAKLTGLPESEVKDILANLS